MTIKDKEYPSSPAMLATTKETLQEMEAMMESVQAQVESVQAQMESIEAVQAELQLMIITEKNLRLMKKYKQNMLVCLAIFAGLMALSIGYYQGAFGVLDIILFVVGIFFVNDLDEKFEYWRGILRQLKQRYL